MSESDSDRPWIEDERRQIARSAIDRAFDASLSLLKWVLTTVALFHSAALIAGFNSDRLSGVMFEGPAWFFLGGIGLALGSGLTLAFGSADYAGRMTNSLWRGEGLQSDNNHTYDPEPTTTIYSGALLLGFSIAAFLLGVSYSGIEIAKLSEQTTHQVDEL